MRPTSPHPVHESRTIDVGVGGLAVTADPETVLVTRALGTCVAVCIHDPEAGVAGLLHVLLPEAPALSTRAGRQPGAFADTGIPLLFDTAYRHGLRKARTKVYLVGGGDFDTDGPTGRQIGRRNILAARRMIWSTGCLVAREMTGGTHPRCVQICAGTGRLYVTSCEEEVVIA